MIVVRRRSWLNMLGNCLLSLQSGPSEQLANFRPVGVGVGAKISNMSQDMTVPLRVGNLINSIKGRA
jgi:hypothetical protein